MYIVPIQINKLKLKSEKAYSTWYSQAVSRPSTNQARPCLASEIRRDRACPEWCGRKPSEVPNIGLFIVPTLLFGKKTK